MESSELLRAYVRVLWRLTGAKAASVFVPLGARTLLIQEGEPPLPELANLQTARAFARVAEVPRSVAGPDGLPPHVESSSPGGWLVRVSESPVPGRTSRRRTDPVRSHLTPAWIGLRPGETDLAAASRGSWPHLLELGLVLTRHAQEESLLPLDAVTGLLGATEFQTALVHSVRQAESDKERVALVLIRPENFYLVNERFGGAAADAALREIADRLRAVVRTSDLLGRYGEAAFAVRLGDTNEVESVAHKLLRTVTERGYLNGKWRLAFSAGIALSDPGRGDGGDPLQMIRHAEQALNLARRAGGGRSVVWRPELEAQDAGGPDRLTGVFTADPAKDHRNMLLLFDTLKVIAGRTDLGELASQVTASLSGAFNADRVGLFRWNGDELHPIGALAPRSDAAGLASDVFELGPERMSLFARSRAERRALDASLPDSTGGPASCYAVPLLLGDECLGCLHIEGRKDSLSLNASDLVFLNALAGQLALALDRGRLADLESRRLRHELNELRDVLKQSRLISRSPQMDALLDTVRRVAQSDATVLITGESGTGKELLARAVHELSARSRKPFAIVDCSAIAASLIDSELFGHEKGAFTGASGQKAGRLAEAHGGTVLLDEIGELPLEAQAKLLRFVQEKQVTPVGGTHARSVDVRIIAATNRDLAAEVIHGRFREDLYHRLNVVTLRVPPLRARPSDILHVANHFLLNYSVQYAKPVRRLSPEAQAALLAHSWPGNVRELQNRIMRTMILWEPEDISPAALGFESPALVPEKVSAVDPATPVKPTTSGSADRRPSRREALAALRSAIGLRLQEAIREPEHGAIPLGRWMSEDLVLAANEAARGNLIRAAALTGIPETTFRRRLLHTRAWTKRVPRPAWERMLQAIAELVRSEESAARQSPESLLVQARRVLLEELSERLPDDVLLGSELAGVTPQTYRRWRAKYLTLAS